jgi:hypothetical protein
VSNEKTLSPHRFLLHFSIAQLAARDFLIATVDCVCSVDFFDGKRL